MSAVEEIQAAIEKLTALQAKSIPGPWRALVASGDHSYVVANGEAVASVASNDGDNEVLRKPTADLIVTLHRTIDAQLAMLDSVLSFAVRIESTGVGYLLPQSPGLMLARSINGVTS